MCVRNEKCLHGGEAAMQAQKLQQGQQQSADDAADGADGKGDDIPPTQMVATATRGIAVDDPLRLAHDLLLSAIFGLATEQKIRLVKDLRVGSFEQYDLSLTAAQKLNSVSFKNKGKLSMSKSLGFSTVSFLRRYFCHFSPEYTVSAEKIGGSGGRLPLFPKS